MLFVPWIGVAERQVSIGQLLSSSNSGNQWVATKACILYQEAELQFYKEKMLRDSVPPMHVNYCTYSCTTIQFMHVTEYVRLITELETAQSSLLSCASNLIAS